MTTDQTARELIADEIAAAVAGTVVTVGGYYEVDIEKATRMIAAALTSAEAAGFARGVKAAAQVVDHCNREGPYSAIGAASRIRALVPETQRAEVVRTDDEVRDAVARTLAAVAAEDPNRLDLDKVPKTHEFHSVSIQKGSLPSQRFKAALNLIRTHSSDYTFGYGPTPSAALKAACEKAREAK